MDKQRKSSNDLKIAASFFVGDIIGMYTVLNVYNSLSDIKTPARGFISASTAITLGAVAGLSFYQLMGILYPQGKISSSKNNTGEVSEELKSSKWAERIKFTKKSKDVFQRII